MSLKQRVYALDHFKNFMNDFCDIQNRLKIIHIGGTNGKGSTTNYIREVLHILNISPYIDYYILKSHLLKYYDH